MRVHVALTPGEFAGLALEGGTALVVDVLRASTTVVTACAAGCRQIIPVGDTATALERRRGFADGTALLAGERDGEPIAGFDLGNSPLEYTAERVGGRTIILTTTNGTAAMMAAGAAAAAGVAALTNLGAAARWAAAQGRDVTVLCSGEKGGLSLEDTVCAGLLVDHLASMDAAVDPTDAATAARRVGQHYATDLGRRLSEECRWARKLARAGRAADLAVCLAVGTARSVPVLEGGVIVPGTPVPEPAR
jgi:2-phosphosulfolactate phosphatase